MQDKLIRNSSVSEIQTIKDDLVSLKDDAATLVRDTQNGAEAIARDGYGQALSAGKSKFSEIESHVKANPGQSILLAFAAGLVARTLLGSRR